MICITGAGGTVGSAVLSQLESSGVPFRAAFHTAAKADTAKARGVDAVVIDYARPEMLRAAFAGCKRLFLLGPSAIDQTRLERNAVDAAQAAGVKAIVKQSVLDAEGEDVSFAKVHRPVERAIEASGLAWTFLRPNGFMQNVMTYMSPSIKSQSAFYSAAGDGRISHVDVRDIAEVAVAALTDDRHAGKAYALTGPEAPSYDELAQAISQAVGRPIAHVNLPPEELKAGMLAEGIPEYLAEWLLDLERYYREGHGSRIASDIREVTGHEPRRMADYLREHAAQIG